MVSNVVDKKQAIGWSKNCDAVRQFAVGKEAPNTSSATAQNLQPRPCAILHKEI